jgi:DNA-binding transcriptional regulator YhcF (GntR family)
MHISDFFFAVQTSSGMPIYRQIMDQVTALVVSGKAKPGDLLPSTRELAEALQVNMMTVSKAYGRLEASGVLARNRGRRMEIAARDGSAPAGVKQRQDELRPLVEQAVVRGLQLKLTERQIQAVVDSVLRENNR